MNKHYNIPVSRPDLSKEDFYEIKKAFDASWISSKSPWVEKFEKAFASKISRTKYAASVNSGTSALFLALKSLGIGDGDEVILPSLTMIASINAVTLTGAKPVLVDCKSFEDFNLDLKEVTDKITKKTKAIMPVHLYGYSCEMDKLIRLAKRKGLFVIEDAAESMGATYRGKTLGSFGDIGCFSLYSNKIITTGNGGMVVTNNQKLHLLITKLRFFDFNEESHFTHHMIGYNLVLSGLQSALGVSQVRRFTKLLSGRRNNLMLYKKYLKKIDNYFIPEPLKGLMPNYWFPAVIFKDTKVKNRVESNLTEKGIETRLFFRPLHLQPVYQALFKNERYPKAEFFHKHGLLLPSYEGLTEKEIKEIAEFIDASV